MWNLNDTQQHLAQGHRFEKIRPDNLWAPEGCWWWIKPSGQHELVRVDEPSDQLLWSHLRARLLFERFLELVDELGLLQHPDDTHLWADAEQRVFLHYDQLDAPHFGRLEEQDIELFREQIRTWTYLQLAERSKDSGGESPVELRHGDSRLLCSIDQQELQRVVESVNSQILPQLHQLCRQHQIPIPTSLDIVCRAVEVEDFILEGRRIPSPHCQPYLRFYQGGTPDLVVYVPELDRSVVFSLENEEDIA